MLLSLAGPLSDQLWRDICRWSDARKSTDPNEWSSDDWPGATRQEVDRFVQKVKATCFTPPTLYRSEHIDCWSMGDVFVAAFGRRNARDCRALLTEQHEVLAAWMHYRERAIPNRSAPDETRWLYARMNEAIDAWGELAETRLVILIRTILGGLWTDTEVEEALRAPPTWWPQSSPESD